MKDTKSTRALVSSSQHTALDPLHSGPAELELLEVRAALSAALAEPLEPPVPSSVSRTVMPPSARLATLSAWPSHAGPVRGMHGARVFLSSACVHESLICLSSILNHSCTVRAQGGVSSGKGFKIKLSLQAGGGERIETISFTSVPRQ